MNPPNLPRFSGLLGTLILAPVALMLGRTLADYLAGAAIPVMCWRHGWVIEPCERCQVWQTQPYTRDLTRADRAEAAAIRRMEKGAKID